MKRAKLSPLFLLMFAIGFLCSAALLWNRVWVEAGDTQVAAGISYQDVTLLSEESGFPAGSWLEALRESGVQYLLLTPEESETPALIALLREYRLSYGLLGTPEESSMAAALYLSEETRYSPRGNGQAIGLIENDTRTGVELPNDTWSAADVREKGYTPVKVMKLLDDYRNRYTEELGGREIEAVLFRGVTDRSQRFLWLAPFTDEEGVLVTDLAVYTDVLDTLDQRLTDRGYTFGETFSTRTVSAPQTPMIVGSALLVAVLAVYLLSCLIPAVTGMTATILLAAASLGCVALGVVLPLSLFQTLASLGAAVVVPCLCVILLQKRMKSRSRQQIYTEFPLFLALFFLSSLFGGLMVAALLSTESYLLEFVTFSGVKAAELIPLVAAVVLLVLTCRSYVRGRKLPRALPVAVVGILFVGGILALLLFRSGDAAISAWETDARDTLERILYVRPRTKEFLGAWPSVAVFLYFLHRRNHLAALPFGVLATVGAVSVVNTYCHLYTPLSVSLMRSLLGLCFGLAAGYAALLVLALLRAVWRAVRR